MYKFGEVWFSNSGVSFAHFCTAFDELRSSNPVDSVPSYGRWDKIVLQIFIGRAGIPKRVGRLIC